MNFTKMPFEDILLLLAFLLSLVSGSPIESPELYSLEKHPTSYPRYRYVYRINDPPHGNFQEKYESRDGDVVQGYYSLLQPNGIIRTVHYTADQSGFHARVSLQPSVDQFENDVAAV